MDAYADVKGRAGNAQTLQDQISEMARRGRQRRRGERISLFDVLNAFKKEEPDEEKLFASTRHISPAFLRDFAQMPLVQARRVLTNAQARYDRKHHREVTVNEVYDCTKRTMLENR